MTNCERINLDHFKRLLLYALKTEARFIYASCADSAKLLTTGYSGSSSSLEESIADYVKNYLLADRHLGDELNSTEPSPAVLTMN